MNAIKFAVALKSQVVIPGTTEMTKKLDGDLVMSDPQLRTIASMMLDGVSVYETDLDVETLSLAFQAILGRKVYFIGYYAKAKDRFGAMKNTLTPTLEPEGWMFFGANPRGKATKDLKAVDISAFLPKK